MRILFLSHYFYPEPFSNTDIARALVQRGHEVEVVCYVPNYPDGTFYPGYSNRERREEELDGIRIRRAWTIPRGNNRGTLLVNFLLFSFTALFTIWRRGVGNYDVSFTSMPSPIFQGVASIVMKKLRGVPAVWWVQDLWPESLLVTLGIRNSFVARLMRWICGFLYRRADLLLVQSEAFRPRLEALGVSPERISFFPNTAPDEFVVIASGQADPAINALFPPTQLRLMFAGNIGESQNLDIIVAAASRLRNICDIQWVIVGSGRDAGRISKRVLDAGVEDLVVLTGRHPMNSMPHFYALADAMIVSLKDTEIFALTVPYKLQTYMSAGKPVIGSISGEARRIIEMANIGFCADANDLEGFCRAVQTFAALDSKSRAAMGSRARAWFEQHYAASSTFDRLERELEAAVRSV